MSQLQQRLQQQYQQPTITIDQFYRLQHRAKTEITNLIDASIPNKDQNRALKSLVDGIFEKMAFEAGEVSNTYHSYRLEQELKGQTSQIAQVSTVGLQAMPPQSDNVVIKNDSGTIIGIDLQ